MTESHEKPWLWPHEAAAILAVTRRTILRYCESGTLVCRRLPSGRYQVSADSLQKIARQMGQMGQPSP